MLTPDQIATLDDAVATFGRDAQAWMLVEEAAECLVALCRLRRKRGTDAQFAEEIADAQIMLAQWERRRLTAKDRAACVAKLVAAEPTEPWIVWCDTDYEADALTAVIPEAVEVRGPHSVERKERALADFAEGRTRVLVTKASIAGFGLNWQHCARVAFVGATFKYEEFYQAVRRNWRYGQARPVDVHVALGATELNVWGVLTAKRDAHDEMKRQMFAAARRAQARSVQRDGYAPGRVARIPTWLRSEAA